MIPLAIMRNDVTCLNDSMRTESLGDSSLEVLNHRNGILIESNEIVENFVAPKA